MLSVAQLFHSQIIIFHHSPQAHGWICPMLTWVWKFLHCRYWTLALASILVEPLPHPYYSGIWWPPRCCFSSKNSGNYGLEVTNETTAAVLVSDLCCVGLHFLAEGHTSGQIISLAYWSNIWEVASTVVMRKWKWLYVNDLKCKNPVYTVAEFWNLCQGGINASVYTRIKLKNMIHQWNKWAALNS